MKNSCSTNDPKEMFQQQILSHPSYPTCLPFVAATTNFQNSHHHHHFVPTNNILPNFMNSSTMNGSVLGGSFKRTQVTHNLKGRVPKKIRSSSETADHILAERKRRLKLTQNFIALSAIIPGLKKMDDEYIMKIDDLGKSLRKELLKSSHDNLQ